MLETLLIAAAIVSMLSGGGCFLAATAICIRRGSASGDAHPLPARGRGERRLWIMCCLLIGLSNVLLWLASRQ
jgi:hypothetical protein